MSQAIIMYCIAVLSYLIVMARNDLSKMLNIKLEVGHGNLISRKLQYKKKEVEKHGNFFLLTSHNLCDSQHTIRLTCK